MNITVLCDDKPIAKFADIQDARCFLDWKRKHELFKMNEQILDKIAAENYMDRKYPGLFPLSLTSTYYDNARKQIEQKYRFEEKSRNINYQEQDTSLLQKLSECQTKAEQQDNNANNLVPQRENFER